MTKKKKVAKKIFIWFTILSLFFSLKKIIAFASSKMEIDDQISYKEQPAKTKNNLLIGMRTTQENTSNVESYKLPVPLINQMSEPALKYGCEVTALSMLLGYYHFDYSKNDLQDRIEKVPYQDEAGYLGDPDEGFVGDATGKNLGTGVNVGPIEKLAKNVVNENYTVVNSTGEELDHLLGLVKDGHPIWVVVTIDYSVPKSSDFLDWRTKNGIKQVSFKHHAAVIIGFDQENVYLNDAYGKEVKIEKSKFNQIYQNMGKQSLYLK